MSLFVWRSRVLFGVLAKIFIALAIASTGRAANVQVVCPGGGPGAYASVSAALSVLDPQGPNNITVSGTCVENIFVDKFETGKGIISRLKVNG